jgi:hypothetical protein
MRRWIGIGIVALLAAGALVALVKAGTDGGETAKSSSTGVATKALADPAGSSVGAPPIAKLDAAASASPTQAGAVKPASDLGALGVPNVNDRVVKHATLEIDIARTKLDRQFTRARSIAEFLGGFVERSDQSRGVASITMRVPVAQFGAALQRLDGLGRVTDRSERGDDVSGQFVDLEARIRNLTAQEGVLQDLMRQARTIPDTITVQQQLSAVRQEIEQLTGQRNLLDNQTSFATISANLHIKGVVPASGEARGTLAQAWHDSVGVGVSIIGGTIVVLGAVIPLALLAGLATGGWVLIRRRVSVHPAGA